jgi:hypothetical protein
LIAPLNQGGGSSEVCQATGQTGLLSYCSSSLRYKRDVNTFYRGLDVVKQLRPITFVWKNNGILDLGFGAEEVALIEPLLATYNEDGAIEGVKYRQITTVLVNAVNEQQAQIDLLKQQLNERKLENDALKAFICSKEPTAGLCKVQK